MWHPFQPLGQAYNVFPSHYQHLLSTCDQWIHKSWPNQYFWSSRTSSRPHWCTVIWCGQMWPCGTWSKCHPWFAEFWTVSWYLWWACHWWKCQGVVPSWNPTSGHPASSPPTTTWCQDTMGYSFLYDQASLQYVTSKSLAFQTNHIFLIWSPGYRPFSCSLYQ